MIQCTYGRETADPVVTPLIVYITRRSAADVYLSGKRALEMWLYEPHYDHRPVTDALSSRLVDAGWQSRHHTSQPARHLLNQDEDLLKAVMEQAILSLSPKGMDLSQGDQWSEALIDGNPGWTALYNDPEWEGKCNTCHKRFLLKVDLRSGTVERVIPYVLIDGAFCTTDAITHDLAIQRHHPGVPLPF